MSILGAIGIGTGLLSGISGFLSDQKTNKLNKAAFELQKQLADKQIEYSDYIMSLAKLLMDEGFSAEDAYGMVIGKGEDGVFRSPLAPINQEIQGASDQEELQRHTVDQEMRRRGLEDLERRRNIASGEADTALRDVNDFRSGVGQVDGTALGNQIALSRRSAINAGFDDAEQAASKLQLRTGSSAVADAIANLGTERSRAQGMIGDPALEGMLTAEQINSNRLGERAGRYNMFTNQANNIYDTPFVASDEADKSYNRTVDSRNFELGKFGQAMGGAGAAAAGVGAAGRGLREADASFMQNRIADPWGSFLSGLSSTFNALGNGGSSRMLGD